MLCPPLWCLVPGMQKRLQIALMAIATSFSLATTPLPAETGSTGKSDAIVSTDENGRKVYVNEPASQAQSRRAQTAPVSRGGLVYWSSTEHRWKPVPGRGPAIQAARSAAAEVNQYLVHDSQAPAENAPRQAFTQQDIDAAIDQAATRHNVDPNLVRAVVKVESNFNPNAVSRKGAMGLMQLMPQTARQLNVTNPFDPQQNVDAGVRHLKKLLQSYNGDVRLSLAAYNAGAGAVARNAGVPNFSETRNYVKRITTLYNNGSTIGPSIFGGPVHDPVRVQRDARGVLYISNTD